LATWLALRAFLVDRVDQQLAATRRQVEAVVRDGGVAALAAAARSGSPMPLALSPSSSTYVEVRDASNRQLAGLLLGHGLHEATPDLPATLPVSVAGPGVAGERVSSFTVGGGRGRYRGPYRVQAATLPGRGFAGGDGLLVAVAVPLAEVFQTLGRLVAIEVLVTVAVLVGVSLLAARLVRVGLRPLDEIAATAGAIAAGDLGRRVARAEPHTEVGRLGLALNRMLGQIEAAFAERRASEARLRRFVADASHELRTPLTSIRGYAELFRRGADARPADLATTMRRIEDEAGRMGVLVDELLLLARLDQGRPLERTQVDLSSVAAAAVEEARVIEPDRPITLVAPGAVVVVGDEHRLRQVAANLLANVRMHTPSGTPVRVGVTEVDGWAVLEVADRGPGLTTEQASRVFERFYRTDPSRSRPAAAWGWGSRSSPPSPRRTAAGSASPPPSARAPPSASACRWADTPVAELSAWSQAAHSSLQGGPGRVGDRIATTRAAVAAKEPRAWTRSTPPPPLPPGAGRLPARSPSPSPSSSPRAPCSPERPGPREPCPPSPTAAGRSRWTPATAPDPPAAGPASASSATWPAP